MIFQESVKDFLFQAVVLGQPLFWMWLYDTELVIIREQFSYSFYFLSMLFFRLIFQTGFSIGFYTNTILLQYISMTILSVYLFNTRYDIKKSLALGFLTVFLNSYYWELPLHLAEVLSGKLHIGMVVQLWRLIPVPFLLKRYDFTVKDRAVLSIGLGLSTFFMVIRFFYRISGTLIYPVNRFVCLFILVKVLIEATNKEYITGLGEK